MRMLRLIFCCAVALLAVGPVWAQEIPAPVLGPRTIVVAVDGSGDFRSIQEALETAKKGDTIRIKAGTYREDITIHSKDHVKLIGDGIDQVIINGKELVGVFHIGKWPYGATNIEVSGMTINEHGGHAMGIFNGKGIVLRNLKINGMFFGQQVQDVRIEDSIIGGSETTGLQFADSQATLIGNVIHDNDHGVTVAGKSDVRLERNVITHNLFEGVVVMDKAHAVIRNNTIAKNGGGAIFLGTSLSEVSGNVVGFNKVGFAVAPSARVTFSHNALFNSDENYAKTGGLLPEPAPELKPDTDLVVDPQFVDIEHDDFRLQSTSSLTKRGEFAYLGAYPPLAPSR